MKTKSAAFLEGSFASLNYDYFIEFFVLVSKWAVPAALVLGALILRFPQSDMEELFEACGLYKKTQVRGQGGRVVTKNILPKIKKRMDTDYGYDLIIEPPSGLSVSDFEQAKEALEQSMDCELEFEKGDGNTIMTNVITNKLPDICEFENIDTAGPCEFPLGMSKKGHITFSLDDATPNLLIGGVPGSGKSVLERLIVTFLGVYKASQGLLKLFLIDCKGGVEFGMFEKCSFVEGYATNRNPQGITDIFRYLMDEMDKRYDIFKNTGYTNIHDYNQDKKYMPFIVTVIDEIANIDNKDVFVMLTDLLRMGRACGIYFVLATQRPSADVLPGNIKANIPATVAFLSRNAVNSEILLDHAGAEKLKGKGHGILQTTKEVEFQCYFLDVPEARQMIKPFIQNRVEGIVKPLFNTDGVIESHD